MFMINKLKKPRLSLFKCYLDILGFRVSRVSRIIPKKISVSDGVHILF